MWKCDSIRSIRSYRKWHNRIEEWKICQYRWHNAWPSLGPELKTQTLRKENQLLVDGYFLPHVTTSNQSDSIADQKKELFQLLCTALSKADNFPFSFQLITNNFQNYLLGSSFARSYPHRTKPFWAYVRHKSLHKGSSIQIRKCTCSSRCRV